MCVPGAVQAVQLVTNAATGIGKTILDYNQQTKNNEYRTQVAINNITAAQNEAKRQSQIGIEKSREEKIEGLKRANSLLAKNAASNTNVFSGSNFLNYQDEQNLSFNNAQNILDSYNQKSASYYQRARNYYNNYQQSQKQYKSSMMKSALNSLGNYTKVASNWYSNNTGDDYYDSI